jgi:hypothetical protein
VERTTRRWLTILSVVVVVYLVLLLSHWVLGVGILPW